MPDDIPLYVRTSGEEDYTRMEEPSEKKPRRGKGLLATIGLGLLGIGLAYTLTTKQPKASQHNQERTELTAEDTTRLKDLSGSRKYVSNKHLTVDEDKLEETRESFGGMSLERIVKVTGLNDMYKRYTGLDDNDEADYEAALKDMWSRKKDGRLSKEFHGDADRMVAAYDQEAAEKTTLKKHLTSLDRHVDKLHDNYDFTRLFTVPDGKGGEKPIHEEKSRFVRNIMDEVDGETLQAYSTTELFPAINPELNTIIYDKLLQEAGKEFLLTIPAMGDDYMSFGPYQLSSKAVNPEGTGTYNDHLPEELQAPESMTHHETWDDHTTSAYLNMIGNATILGNKLFTNGLLTAFNDQYEQLPERKRELLATGLLSTAHNNPSLAARGLANYVSEAERGNVEFEDVARGLQMGRVQPYYVQSVENKLVSEHR
ncbi:hypothetical protein KY327_03805 [Candidatus Woesearchaeota archaeon]|nr:hypothetical protein [Candidatus Woesearchaeota archaeon]